MPVTVCVSVGGTSVVFSDTRRFASLRSLRVVAADCDVGFKKEVEVFDGEREVRKRRGWM
jgi:hypothetical protein